MKIKNVKIPLYGGNIKVYIGDSNLFLDHMVNKYSADLSDSVNATTKGLCFTLSNSIGEQLTGMWLPSDYSVAILAHEALHATWYIQDYFGVKVSADNNESQAYLLQYLVEQIMKI
tara:strand:+ start:1127 stop:1474 length:348 start_codon:yes stop_codon:yes gene_type:complete